MKQDMMLLSTKMVDIKTSDKPVMIKKVPLRDYNGYLLVMPFYKPVSKILKNRGNEI